MRIDRIVLTNFRNFESGELTPAFGANIFFGDNGAGKTNLLEALFTLCLGRSQRGARDVMMVREGNGDFFRIEGIGHIGQPSSEQEVKLACAYQKGGRKKITVDENPVRISRLYQLFRIVSMAPEDVSLFSGSPGTRRRFLDLHLSQGSPTYLADLTDYNKALAQKNSFLKNSPGMECPFDPLLIQLGSNIMKARHNYIEFLNNNAPDYYRKIAGEQSERSLSSFSASYKPNVDFETPDEIASCFEDKLNRYRPKESILEMAIVGPHRDDIEFTVSGFPIKGYGSMGEQRSAAVAVMMASADFLEEKQGEKPILLLDEVFAELDPSRRENLAALFESFEQIFLTTAVAPPAVLYDNARVYHIADGKIREG
ncbi:MAG: DNA replication and repair protein RecF [candidate division Zixibacteria bacterium]|nr:DNA replication and repair protein RecF [candidate division Zixibacteria bacterium]